ncbi:MAG TPA: hypothetical protein VIV54_15855 [Burkholderiales bacterium]
MSDKANDRDPAQGILKKLRRRKLVAWAIVAGTIVVGIGSFAGAVTKLAEVFEKFSDPKPTSVPEVQNTVLATAQQAKLQFDATTRGREVPIPKSEFAPTEKLLRRLERLDPGNGHAIYYSAFILRWVGDRPGSHTILFEYIERAAKADALQKDDDGLAKYCFDYWRGFCKQRAAYANHVLALDLRKAANDEKNPAISLKWRKKAIECAEAALKLYGEFSDPRQGTPTAVMLDELRKELAAAAAK